MILPGRHVELDSSLVGVGATILAALPRERSVSEVWSEVRQSHGVNTFDSFARGLSFLYLVGAVDLKDDLLRRSSA